MCLTEEKMLLRAAENERGLHAMDTSFFSATEGRPPQRVLRTSTDQAS